MKPINTLNDIAKTLPELKQVVQDTRQLTDEVTTLLAKARDLVEGTQRPR